MARRSTWSRVAGFVGALGLMGVTCAGPRNTARSETPRPPAEMVPLPPPQEERAQPAHAPCDAPGPPGDVGAFLGPGDLVPSPEGRARAKRSPILGETAFLFIVAEPPSAKILVDGVRVGEGQAFLRVRGSRWKVLRVEASGYEPIEGAIEVQEREVVKVRLALDPTGGRLTVVTDVPGAEARLDGQFVGTTPLTLKRIAVGVHHLVLRAGSWEWSGDVEVRAGETRLIEMTVGSVVAPPPPIATVPAPASRPEGPPPIAPATPSPPAATTPATVSEPVSDSPAGKGWTPVTPQKDSPAATEPTGVFGVPGSQSQVPSAQPATAPSGRPDCGAVCTRFIQAVSGSESIREPIFNRCRERCQSGDLRFSVCAWKARNMDDVSACMNLPE